MAHRSLLLMDGLSAIQRRATELGELTPISGRMDALHCTYHCPPYAMLISRVFISSNPQRVGLQSR